MSQRYRFFLLGVIVGAGVTAAVFIWRDVSPGSARAQPPAAAAAKPAAGVHDSVALPLPPDVEAQRQAFEARLAEQSDDLVARKRLSLLLLSHGRMVGAFEHAARILEQLPDDPDGLYVQGEVRLAMGSLDQSLALLDRVLAQYPGHVLALTAKGRAQYLSGQTQEAVATWESAWEASGRQDPVLEQLLAEARGLAPAAGENPQPLVSH